MASRSALISGRGQRMMATMSRDGSPERQQVDIKIEVVDDQGNGLDGAKVSYTSGGQPYEAFTSRGWLTLTLFPGRYWFAVSLDGYRDGAAIRDHNKHSNFQPVTVKLSPA
jgi:hypothetical protein